MAAEPRETREQLLDFFRYLRTNEGSRPEAVYAAIKGAKRVSYVPGTGARFKLEHPRGPPTFVKMFDTRDFRGMREAFLLAHFSPERFPRGHKVPRVPPVRSPRFAGTPALLNVDRHVRSALLEHREALEAFELVDVRLKDRPETSTDVVWRRAEEEDQSAQPPYDPDEDSEERANIDPVFRARRELTDALGDPETETRRFVLTEVEGSATDAFSLLLTGDEPAQNARILLVQLLSTLDSLYFRDGFVHGGIDLQKVDVVWVGRAGAGALVYDTIDEGVQLEARTATSGAYPVFAFRDLTEAHPSRELVRGIAGLAEEGERQAAAVEWAAGWRDPPGDRDRSHRLDQHALGMRVLETIAWRLSNVRDPPAVRDELWDVASYCASGLALDPRELSGGSVVPVYDKRYSAELRKVYKIYLGVLLNVLTKRDARSGAIKFAEAFYADYGEVFFRRIAGGERENLATLTSEPMDADSEEVLKDVVYFAPAAVSRSAEISKEYWRDAFFDRHRSAADRPSKKRREIAQ